MAGKTIYKVVETILSNGKKEFMPQKSDVYPYNDWKPVAWMHMDSNFKATLEEANAIIENHIKEEEERVRVVETIDHPYPQK